LKDPVSRLINDCSGILKKFSLRILNFWIIIMKPSIELFNGHGFCDPLKEIGIVLDAFYAFHANLGHL